MSLLCRCAQADDTDRPISIMTFSDQPMTLNFDQIFKMTCLRSNDKSLHASRHEEHDAVKMNAMSLLSQELLPKHFSLKRLFLELLLSGGF